MSFLGLGCVKTQTCCGDVEWRSKALDVLFFSREARLSAPTDAEAQKYRNPAVPTLLVRSSCLAFHATMCAEGDLEACWNRILTIFERYTLSRSQGHDQEYSEHANRASKPPETEIRVRCSELTLCAINGHEQLRHGETTECRAMLIWSVPTSTRMTMLRPTRPPTAC